MSQRYYIVDYGKEMVDIAETVVNRLKENKHHVVVYVTDLPDYQSTIEVTEDEFLTHFNMSLDN